MVIIIVVVTLVPAIVIGLFSGPAAVQWKKKRKGDK